MAPRTEQNLSRPVIGVTGNDKSFSPSWLCIKLAIFLSGGVAVRISIRHNSNLTEFDGLIISGGDDIHPSMYGGEASVKAKYDTARDQLEKRFIILAIERNIPMVGICRGYQLFNVVTGGSLFTDIRHLRSDKVRINTIFPRNTVNIENTSRLCSIFERTTMSVNSLHHQAIDTVAAEAKVVAHDLDRIPHALESITDTQFIGVQWHPEYLLYWPGHIKLFRWLVRSCQKD